MDTQKGPSISGPMFPQHHRDKELLPQTRLKGTIIGVRPGRRVEETAQIITIKLEDWEQNPNKLLNMEIDLILPSHS